MSIGFLPANLRDSGYKKNNFDFTKVDPARTVDHGFNLGSIKLAQSYGYSDRQIKTALQQWAGGWGNTLGGHKVKEFMQGVGPTHKGLHIYQGQDSGIGIDQWQAAMDAGVAPADLRRSTAESGQTWGWRAEDAYQEWKDDQRDAELDARRAEEVEEDEKRWAERIADVPTIEDLAAAMPEPKIRAGRDYATSGRSAQGMRIKRGTKFAEGGKRGTKGYFGRGAKFTGTTTPSMNISGTANQGGSQALNTLNTP